LEQALRCNDLALNILKPLNDKDDDDAFNALAIAVRRYAEAVAAGCEVNIEQVIDDIAAMAKAFTHFDPHNNGAH
jgi:hypothetical protein